MDILTLDEVVMVSKAVEIQSLMDKPKGLNFNSHRMAWDKYGRVWFKKSGDQVVWIPYQEDLQIIATHQSLREFEKVDFAIYSCRTSPQIRHLLNRFNDFVDMLLINEAICIAPHLSQFDSIRQLWLAFAMKEKYGKIWKGEQWVVL